MAKTNANAKPEKAENTAAEKPVETPKAKAPVVAAGEYYKLVKVRFKDLICGSYGTFNAGEVGEIPLADANFLTGIGKCEIIKD